MLLLLNLIKLLLICYNKWVTALLGVMLLHKPSEDSSTPVDMEKLMDKEFL